MVFFSQLPAVMKDTIFGAARKLFGPSLSVTALKNSQDEGGGVKNSKLPSSFMDDP